ncbi:MAG: alkaline phosphatase family protein [Flavobacteriales bacterium]|nr:alkaline phosphatase family protein [Flavobacteriales bacterium]
MNSKRKLLVLGWDAADWEVIDDLLAKGEMPALKRILDKGVRGNLATMDPPISPMLWTTIATGVEPEKHGILGFAEPDPEGKGLRPLFSTSRKVKAFWNMFSQYGLKSNIVGWWPSHPAEPINGVMVSNFFQMVTHHDPSQWKIAPGTVFPDHLGDKIADLRVHPDEITPELVMPFIPELYQIPHEDEKIVWAVRKELAHAATIQAVSTWLMQHSEWDIMGVYFDFIDHMSHLAMKFRAPKLSSVPEEKFRFYSKIVDGAYRFQDMMLGRMLDLIDEQTAIMILSDHGFESGDLRPRYVPKEPSGPTKEHSPFGIYFLKGPGIPTNEKIYGASVTDITPTILHYFGLPVAKDMIGKPLLASFTEQREIKWIDSWENHQTNLDPGLHPGDLRVNAWNAQEALEQLIELGYIERPEGTTEHIIAVSKAEVDYYLAQSLSFRHRYEEAISILEKICNQFPDIHRFRTLLVQNLIHTRQWNNALLELEKLKGISDSLDIQVWYFIGKIYLSQHRGKLAYKSFYRAHEKAPKSIDILLRLGDTSLVLQEYKDAEKWYSQVVERNPKNVFGHFGMGMVMLRSGDADTAIDHFLDAIEIRNFFPQAHFQLGEALRLNGDVEDAENAYLFALKQNPEMLKARNQLIQLYRNQLKNEEKANEQLAILNAHQNREINVISGPPASGIGEIGEKLLSNGVKVLNHLPSQVDQKAELQLSLLNSSPGGDTEIHLMTMAQLMRVPENFKIRLLLSDPEEISLLNAQLVFGGKEHLASKKIFPANLSHLNRIEKDAFLQWQSQRSGLEVLKVNLLDQENDEILSQILSFFH